MFSVGALLTVLSVVPTLIVGNLHPFEECSQGSRTSGECLAITTEVSDSGVSLGASETTPGSTGSTGSTGTSGGDSSAPAPVTTSQPPRWRPPPRRNPVLGSSECTVILQGSCRGSSPPRNRPVVTPPTPVWQAPVAPTPPSSISDLVAFQPSGSAMVIEPGWWSLPRVPTNMYSTAGVDTQAGELLGWPIQVRFTPQTYRWSFGDGANATRSTAGGSWGGAQFSATNTSHTYRAPGVYSIGLTIEYSVSYRFEGGPYIGLPGVVTRGVGVTRVQVLRVSPVLTNKGCAVSDLQQGRCR